MANVLIVGDGGNVSLSVLKCLRMAEHRYKVFSADSSRYTATMYLADGKRLIPKPCEKNYVGKLAAVCKERKIDALIPCSDSVLKAINHSREKLESGGLHIIAPSEEVVEMAGDKWETYKFMKKRGIPVPNTVLPEDCKEITKKGFPVVVKPRNLTMSQGFTVCKTESEVKDAIRRIERPIVQEYIKGDDDWEYTVGMVKNKAGELATLITLRRILDGNGLSRITESGSYPVVDSLSKKISEKLRTSGPFNAQFIINKRPKLLEINARFSSTAVIRAFLGINEPDIMIKHVLYDEPIPKVKGEKKIVTIRHYEESLVPSEEIMG